MSLVFYFFFNFFLYTKITIEGNSNLKMYHWYAINVCTVQHSLLHSANEIEDYIIYIFDFNSISLQILVSDD